MDLRKVIRGKEDDIAYIINDKKISYRELFDSALRYGDLLKKQGDGPVIIYGHKSINVLIAIFACISANRTYIPIDLCTPIERINKIIEITNCDIVLTDEIINISNCEISTLEELGKYEKFDIKTIDNDIVYIIFTSGSTGDPKGVPISYDNLFNFIYWISNLKPLCNYDNVHVLNQASFSFDLSVADLFYSVYNGHQLVALDSKAQNDYNQIFETIKFNEINVMVITPTFMKLCLVNKEFNSINYSSLNCIYFCGEQLEVGLVKQIYDRFPDMHIINAYGPTEATSAVCATNITRDMLDYDILPCGDILESATNIDIIENQIVLSGQSVFNGYLNSLVGGYYKVDDINYFKTGDIGYIRDNKLYCKGRIDSQIKYKGYRIELMDIEYNLRKIIGVKDCVVIAKYYNDYNIKMIKAYVVLENYCSVDFVKEELTKLIPLYMIPKQIIKLDEIPINCNGKIDRRKLSEL